MIRARFRTGCKIWTVSRLEPASDLDEYMFLRNHLRTLCDLLWIPGGDLQPSQAKADATGNGTSRYPACSLPAIVGRVRWERG